MFSRVLGPVVLYNCSKPPPSDLEPMPVGSPPLGLRRGCCASVGTVHLSLLGWSLGDCSDLSFSLATAIPPQVAGCISLFW